MDVAADASISATADNNDAGTHAMDLEIETLADNLSLSAGDAQVATSDCDYSSETSDEEDDDYRSKVDYIAGFYSRATAMLHNIIMPAIDATCSTTDTSDIAEKHKTLPQELHKQLDIAQSIAKDMSKPVYQLIVACVQGFGASDVCASLCGNLIKVRS
jgi:hypothetical protein